MLAGAARRILGRRALGARVCVGGQERIAGAGRVDVASTAAAATCPEAPSQATAAPRKPNVTSTSGTPQRARMSAASVVAEGRQRLLLAELQRLHVLEQRGVERPLSTSGPSCGCRSGPLGVERDAAPAGGQRRQHARAQVAAALRAGVHPASRRGARARPSR